jgi:serine/threonine-protein phosphatase 6 catalytic subunit
MGVELDKWIEKVKRCEYLAEDELKALCEYVSTRRTCQQVVMAGRLVQILHQARLRPQVKEILVEESNVQPVQAPVTVSMRWEPRSSAHATCS